jgi:hypothetical protein
VVKIERLDAGGRVEMVEHREPPRPPFENAPTGTCRMCGASPLPKRKRRWCSDACAETWVHVNQPAWCSWRFRLDTFGQREARCFECGATEKEALAAHPESIVRVKGTSVTQEMVRSQVAWHPLELDHIRPLYSLNDEERLQLRWWLPFNLQLLCHWCHAAKSAREARERWAAANPDGALARRMRVEKHGYDPLDPQMSLAELGEAS